MNIAESLGVLKSYSSGEIKLPANLNEKEKLITAIVHFARLSDWQNLGICSDNLEEGINSLREYLKALNYPSEQIITEEHDPSKASYIKYNTQKMSHLIEPYWGEYRGVLISYQSEDPQIEGTFGYFPLNLFS
jgi:Domain of unknown function (DUF1824)